MSYSRVLSIRYEEVADSHCSGTNFAGVDIRFSNEYEALEREIGKVQSIHGGGQVDWLMVLEKSEALLRDTSKDLRIAVWLCWALYQRESFDGLLAGLSLLRQLCEHHWPLLYPQKVRTRASAIGWLVPRLEQAFTKQAGGNESPDALQGISEHLACLDEVLTRELAEDAFSLGALRRQLAGMQQPGKETAPVVEMAVAASPLTQPDTDALLRDEKSAHKAVRALQESARSLCAQWMGQSPPDFRGLRLGRTLAWLSIESLPVCDHQQITPLRGLPADKLKHYRERFEQGDFTGLLIELEGSLARSPFWFDGQRLVWECLQMLKAHAAMKEVETHLALFLQRLSGVESLHFHDGIPFASPMTRSWINTHVLISQHRTTALPLLQHSSGSVQWSEALQRVIPILQQDGLKAAVQAFKQDMQGEQTSRVRFLWRMAQARLCLLAGRYDLAALQLETLDEQLRDSNLHRWEPDLMQQVLQLLLSAYDALPAKQGVSERKDDVHRRLCHLDLEVVLE